MEPMSSSPTAGREGSPERSAGLPSRDEARAPEVVAVPRAQRRRFTAEYKLSIVRAADAVQAAGEIGALLRREGLYSSHLVMWRKQFRAAALRELSPKRRGPKAKATRASDLRVAQLEREIARLQRELFVSNKIIEAQKKLAEILQAMDAEEAARDGKPKS
jgi:transposase-like protein